MRLGRLVGPLDDRIGAAIDRGVRSHHRRRLRALGWEQAFDAPAGGWAAVEPPPRTGNAVEVLVDGSEALPRVEAAIRGARSHVHLAGWHFSPDFRLERGGVTLRELLAEAAERVDVRVLAWAGSPLPLFHPDRAEVRDGRERLVAGTRIRYALDRLERPMHCHHEKLVIVDGELAFVGGIDLTSLDGDRLDHADHPPRGAIGWHDAAACLRGPVVADVADHFALRWRAVTGESLPQAGPPPPAGDVEVQLVRTVPERVYPALPRGDFGIFESYVRAIRAAEQLIYLESQFLWSPELVEILAEKLRDPPDDRFRIVALLPARPNNGQDDTRGQVAKLVDADSGNRFLACTLVHPGASTQVYVHAKVAIVDDAWLTLGSANLNDHSLFNDTEMNVVVHDAALARAVRLRLWSEHLDAAEAELGGDPTTLIDERWRPLAEEQADRLRRGELPTARLARLAGVSHRSRALLGPVNGLLVDG